MFKIIACIVVYNNSFEEIKDMVKEFYKENINQKLVIVDNSNTGYLKDNLLLINNEIEYIISEYKGYGHGNNLVIKKYEGQAKYFLIMNPDIFIKFEDLVKLLNYADKISEFGIIMPKIIFPDGELQYVCKLFPNPFNLFVRRFLGNTPLAQKMDYEYELRFTNYEKEMIVPVLSGSFMLCDYGKLIKENGFNSIFFMYMEDVDLSRRMYKHGNYFYPEISVIHKHNKESYRSLKMVFIHILSAIKYFNKWNWFSDKERKEINKKIIKSYKKGNV